MAITEQDCAELHRLLSDFSDIGKTADGGVRRLAATSVDGQARDRLKKEFLESDLKYLVDPIGNMFGISTFINKDAPFILSGSHLDSQETGGRLDGTYGVIASLIAIKAIRRRLNETSKKAKRNLAVVNWTNEEGARFQPSLIGSSYFTGALDIKTAQSITDADNKTLSDALEEIGYCGTEQFNSPVERYVELHIEQGPELEKLNSSIGIVTSAWAARKILVEFNGAPSHTGPTPMSARRDALLAASKAIAHLHKISDQNSTLHVSAARMTIYPNSPNVVACKVSVWFEFRHPTDEIAFEFGEQFLLDCKSLAQSVNVDVSIKKDEKRNTQLLDISGINIVKNACAELGYQPTLLKTVAGHDAIAIQRKIPATLIFVPSINGLSHSPLENTSKKDLEHGLNVLIETLWMMITNED